MAENVTNTTKVAPATLEERVARLRAKLSSSPQGRKTIIELSPPGMVQTNPNIINFTDWQQWSQWSQSS